LEHRGVDQPRQQDELSVVLGEEPGDVVAPAPGEEGELVEPESGAPGEPERDRDRGGHSDEHRRPSTAIGLECSESAIHEDPSPPLERSTQAATYTGKLRRGAAAHPRAGAILPP